MESSSTRAESLISCNKIDDEAVSSSTSSAATKECLPHEQVSTLIIGNSSSTSNEGGNESKVTSTETSGFNTNQQQQSESSDQKNDDSLTFSTAFTISFEDNSNSSKKLGIKDSIRKFAPPKPLTIEKPRPAKNTDHGQDYSLMSIESAPAGLSKPSVHKGCSHSSRSSSRRSNSSRQSNISESAAFLIDKMLDNKRTDLEPSSLTHHEPSSSSFKANIRSHSSLSKRVLQQYQQKQKEQQQLNRLTTYEGSDKPDNELDHCEDRSDNGTYIVGTDQESEAARRKIDELFGVVKAAEASVIAETALRNHRNSNFTDVKATSTPRQSRVADRKPLNQKRQEHINRLAYKRSPVSRSSSSSRHDNSASTDHYHQNQTEPPRSSSRHSRTSSRDRTSRAQKVRSRRSVSQSSRQSSNRELSDGETRSSRSSLHNDINEASQDSNSISSHPNMKFNRAFALRRARLGLGEPIRASNQDTTLATPEQLVVASSSSSAGFNPSQKNRHQINTNTYKAGQTMSSSGSANFSRDDGGRFSLRMKSNPLSGRLISSALASSNRSPQHNTGGILDSYLSRVPSNKASGTIPNHISTTTTTNNNNNHHHHHHQQQPAQQQQESQLPRNSTKLTAQQSFTSTGMPYQTGDELETTLSPSRYWLLQKAMRMQQQQQKKFPTELESDTDSQSATRFNNTFNSDYEANNFSSLNESYRAGSSSSATGRHGSASQLGALDSLVISAISSLSLKIRHSVCEILIEHAKKLPAENETRLIVEEILPQLITSNSARSKSPTSIEEIDQSLYFDLAHTLKNLKKVEQMVDVINLISDQLQPYSSSSSSQNNSAGFKTEERI